jgi:hypothetical protein
MDIEPFAKFIADRVKGAMARDSAVV